MLAKNARRLHMKYPKFAISHQNPQITPLTCFPSQLGITPKTGHPHSVVRLQKNMQQRVVSSNSSSPYPRRRRQGDLRRSISKPQLHRIWGNCLLSTLLLLQQQQQLGLMFSQQLSCNSSHSQRRRRAWTRESIGLFRIGWRRQSTIDSISWGRYLWW